MVGSGTVKMALFSKFLSLLIVAHLLPLPEKGVVPLEEQTEKLICTNPNGAGYSLYLLFVRNES